MAKNVLLPIEEVKIWLQHLNSVAENRRRGAIKAAETWCIKSLMIITVELARRSRLMKCLMLILDLL